MKTVTLPLRQMSIAYDEAGTGEPIVFLHGFPLDRQMWQPQIEGLSGHYRVLAFDYPGFGDSSPSTEGFTIDSLADITADFLDAIGITGRAIVAGLSMGGYVALAFARRHPERLRALILADTRAEADSEEAKANRDLLAEVARQEGPAAVIDKMLPKLIEEGPLANLPDVVKMLTQIAGRQTATAIVHALQAMKERPDATPDLSRIAVSTLVIVGENDLLTPPQVAKLMADHIVGSSLVTIPGVGHISNLQAPGTFNDAIRSFVNRPRN